jgi:uncharacterized RDD family membrane protein YckC
MEQILPNQTPDLLQDIESEILLHPASTGQRFANYIIDVIAFVILYVVLLFAFDSFSNELFYPFMQYPILILYYTIFEGITQGRTLGKYITRTKVYKTDGGNITFKDAFLRSLSRLVPFEPFSAFNGYPWHDKWTNTIVSKVN